MGTFIFLGLQLETKEMAKRHNRRKRAKSSRNANLQRRINMVRNGMEQAGPSSPIFVVKGKRLIRITRPEYDRLTGEAESLSYFAGYQILAEHLV